MLLVGSLEEKGLKKSQGVDRLQIGALTHPGVIREKNEDCYSIIRKEDASAIVVIVADGMGGHKSGEQASKIATSIAQETLEQRLGVESLLAPDICDVFTNIMEKANAQVIKIGAKNIKSSGMGTTLTILGIQKDEFVVSHVGDSRVYVVNENTIKRITTDHSYVQDLIDNGTITPEQAQNHPRRNVITKAVGGDKTIKPDFYRGKISANDSLLVCTDGLTNMVEETLILEILNKDLTADDAVKELVNLANDNGGSDNVTAVLVRI